MNQLLDRVFGRSMEGSLLERKMILKQTSRFYQNDIGELPLYSKTAYHLHTSMPTPCQQADLSPVSSSHSDNEDSQPYACMSIRSLPNDLDNDISLKMAMEHNNTLFNSVGTRSEEDLPS
jgi:hypothetical protein